MNIQKLLNNLEDAERPLLGPNVKWLKLWGLWLPKHKWKKTMFMTIHVALFIFAITQFIDIWLSRSDLGLFLQNMRFTMLSSVTVPKIITFLIWQDKWKSIINYASQEDIERRKTHDRIRRGIIRKYTKYCRTITYFYWFLIYCTVVMIILQPVLYYTILSSENTININVQVTNSWLPIDTETVVGYSIKMSYQILVVLYTGGWISSFDTNAIAILIFFKGDLELLREDAKYLFRTEDKPRTETEAMTKLAECHKRHSDLLKYFDLLDSCLSPLMMIYVIVGSIMLCAAGFQITFQSSSIQRYTSMVYLLFGVSQLFMFCWHSNEVFFASKDLSLGPYESIWWSRDVSEQKNIIILTHQFNKTIILSAGPFSEIAVATFISIVKGAYSYYTLLN